MDKKELTITELEHLAMLMAQALPDLECPECCGPVHEFVEAGAKIYQEEWEWAYFCKAIIHTRVARKTKQGDV